MIIDTFTAANTAKGFYSFFDNLLSDDSLKRIYLIKGGPGCGKSTFMKKCSQKFDKCGCDIEQIHCSSDYESLDGIRIINKGIVIIDATPPHSHDMKYPGAFDSIIDLSQFWNNNDLIKCKSEIKSLYLDISENYKRVYSTLKAASSIQAWKTSIIDKYIDSQQIILQIRKIIKQNAIASIQSTPKVTHRFISAFTKDGIKTYNNTYETLCDEFIVLEDKTNVSSLFFNKLYNALTKMGYDTILFHNPLSPDSRIESIIMPQLRIGFVANGHIYSPTLDTTKIIKNINTKAFINKDFYSNNKNKLNFAQKLENEIITTVFPILNDIKTKHDALESYYINSMDYVALNRFTERFLENI